MCVCVCVCVCARVGVSVSVGGGGIVLCLFAAPTSSKGASTSDVQMNHRVRRRRHPPPARTHVAFPFQDACTVCCAKLTKAIPAGFNRLFLSSSSMMNKHLMFLFNE